MTTDCAAAAEDPPPNRLLRKTVTTGLAAPLRRGNAGPYQRPPPARLTTESAKVQDHRVALTARIRRSPYGTWPVLRVSASTPSAWSSGAEEEPSGGVDLCVP